VPDALPLSKLVVLVVLWRQEEDPVRRADAALLPLLLPPLMLLFNPTLTVLLLLDGLSRPGLCVRSIP
jgi:hypothetical protein